MTKPKAPGHLSPEAQRLWSKVAAEYGIVDAAGRLLLTTGLEAFDRMRGAQADIARDGATVVDRFGQPKPHPLLTTERDSRAQMLMAFRQLNLDLQPLHPGPGRPGGT